MVGQLREKIKAKKALIATIGMGYIGLSLLDAFGQAGFPLLGYDLNADKVNLLKNKKAYLNFINHDVLFSLMEKGKFRATSENSDLKEADVIIISVPTTLDEHKVPDLSNLRNAFKMVYKNLKKDQLIILQSSTYPGTTEEELLPVLQKSDYEIGKDIFLAHVPEVADIGNEKYKFHEVPRIISGITNQCQGLAKELYQTLGCPVYMAENTRIAEAAKLLQNSYRLVNISFINEMKIMFDRLGIDVWDVIDAASTKPFGFTPFYPSPGAGGDCIPIAPFYLVWKAQETNGPTTMLEQAGRINENMPDFVFEKIVQGLNKEKKMITEANILFLGVAYKKDVNDFRESPGLAIIAKLLKMDAKISYHDPFIPKLQGIESYPDINLESIKLDYKKLAEFDAVVITTEHSIYDIEKIVKNSILVVDTRNATKNIKFDKQNIIKA